jgi:hypothetical protein
MNKKWTTATIIILLLVFASYFVIDITLKKETAPASQIKAETTGPSDNFVEFVSSVNNFVPPLPLDIASLDGKVIYGANPADSKLYVFRRK